MMWVARRARSSGNLPLVLEAAVAAAPYVHARLPVLRGGGGSEVSADEKSGGDKSGAVGDSSGAAGGSDEMVVAPGDLAAQVALSKDAMARLDRDARIRARLAESDRRRAAGLEGDEGGFFRPIGAEAAVSEGSGQVAAKMGAAKAGPMKKVIEAKKVKPKGQADARTTSADAEDLALKAGVKRAARK